MSGCDHYQELISRLLDEDIGKSEHAALAEHLKSCSECSLMYSAFAGVSEIIENDMVEAPESIRINVMAELRRSEIVKKNKKNKSIKTLLGAAACLALVLAAGFASGKVFSRSENTVAAVPAEAPAAVFTEEAALSDTAPAPEAPAEAPAEIIELASAEEEESTASSANEANLSRFALPKPVDNASFTELLLPDWEEIASILAGEEADISMEELECADSFCIEFSLNGEVYTLSIFMFEDSIYYTDPISGSLRKSGCNVELLTMILPNTP